MTCLQIFAGARARAHLAENGLRATDIAAVPAAAGGPKGLVLTALDRFLFADWFAGPGPAVHLVGASIGAWRMACAAAPQPAATIAQMAQRYIAEDYEPPPGQAQSVEFVGARYAALIDEVVRGKEAAILAHPRLRLHILTDRARGLLRLSAPGMQALGFASMALANVVDRRLLGAWLERVVFSDPRARLPLQPSGLPTAHADLLARNLQQTVLASGSIPFWFPAVHDIPGAPPGRYWDGGIGDYQLHWPWNRWQPAPGAGTLVLYPHYEARLVPGWFDKSLRWRHRPRAGLDNLLLLAPSRAWVAGLPGGRLPDRHDFLRLRHDPQQRRTAWTRAVAESERLAEDFARWLDRGCPLDAVRPLGARNTA